MSDPWLHRSDSWYVFWILNLPIITPCACMYIMFVPFLICSFCAIYSMYFLGWLKLLEFCSCLWLEEYCPWGSWRAAICWPLPIDEMGQLELLMCCVHYLLSWLMSEETMQYWFVISVRTTFAILLISRVVSWVHNSIHVQLKQEYYGFDGMLLGV